MVFLGYHLKWVYIIYCTDKINEWYSKNSLDDLIEDFKPVGNYSWG
jgi:hypothetical protein